MTQTTGKESKKNTTNKSNTYEVGQNNDAKLGAKIERLSIAIGALAKDGNNSFSNYKYISNEQMVTALRHKCLEYGISIIPSFDGYEEKEFMSDKGKLTIRTIVTMFYKIIDLETGHFEISKFVGAEQDTGGKSMQQAITQCTKYFYFKLFNVSSQEDKDADAVTNEIIPPTPEPKETPILNAEQFKLAMESDIKGIKATLDALESGKIKGTANQRKALNNQLETLNK